MGEFAISVPINVRTGAPARESETVFLPRGVLVRSKGRAADGTLDPRPAYTRVSAIVTIEERFFDPVERRGSFTSEQIHDAGQRGDRRLLDEALHEAIFAPRRAREPMWVEHDVFVVHNPLAAQAINEAVFDGFPQLVRRGSTMEWSDGHPAGL